MNSEKTAIRRTPRRSTRLAGAIAFCVAVATVGYGIAEMPTHLLPAPVAATAMVTPEVQTATSDARPAAPIALPATGGPAGVAASADRIESPRECALDKGITDACTFAD